MPITRRSVVQSLAGLMAPVALPACAPEADAFQRNWQRFKRDFMSPSGRILDTGNGGISHSEGQGFGLLLAEAADDYAAFKKIKSWTDSNLRIRPDRLHAWRYSPGSSRTDLNNATDGDILIAWALIRAADRWHMPLLLKEAALILNDLQSKCVSGHPTFGLVLKPGAEGFETDRGLIINLSYYVFPALSLFDRTFYRSLWGALSNAGTNILEAARFGAHGLPPDWIELTGEGSLEFAADYQSRYGWNALRLPLYLFWSAADRQTALMEPYRALIAAYRDTAQIPAWIDLVTGEIADFPVSEGGRDIYRLVQCQSNHEGPQWRHECADWPQNHTGWRNTDYYSAALSLLAQLAWRELAA